MFASRVWNNPEDTFVGLTAAQDYLSIRGQAQITSREDEILGRSDLGIVTLRKLFWREMELQEAGQPTKSWQSLDGALHLPEQPGQEALA